MKRCLMVEKSSVIRKVAKRILDEPDRLVVEAETATEALSMCDAQMPDCIVVEIDPVGMELEDFLRAVRAMQTDVEPLIVVSMIEMDLVRMTKAKRAGADDYMLKPFDRSQLLSRFDEFGERAA